MTEMKDPKTMTTAELTALIDSICCPDGLRTPFNSMPLPTSKPALLRVLRGLRQRAADSASIDRVVRGRRA